MDRASYSIPRSQKVHRSIFENPRPPRTGESAKKMKRSSRHIPNQHFKSAHPEKKIGRHAIPNDRNRHETALLDFLPRSYPPQAALPVSERRVFQITISTIRQRTLPAGLPPNNLLSPRLFPLRSRFRHPSTLLDS
jgi:hypothetical protein